MKLALTIIAVGILIIGSALAFLFYAAKQTANAIAADGEDQD